MSILPLGQNPAADPAAAANTAKVQKAAQDFVAVALNELLKPMFDGVNDPQSMFGGGAGEEMFQPMLIEQTARHIASAGGFGLTETVTQAMLRLQEKTS